MAAGNLSRFFALLLALSCSMAAAQTASSPAPQQVASTHPADGTDPDAMTTVSVNVKVVNVLATVHDKHGKVMSDLTRDDFVLTEDGKPQTIRYFTRDTNLPLTLGLLVDTSLSQRRVLEEERGASLTFLKEMVREEKDKAFIIHFDKDVELLEDLTSSQQKLESAVNDLHTPHSPPPPRNPGNGPMHNPAAGTLLYDAVFLASDELMKKQQGRKAVIILSDGVDFGSKETLDYAIESAQRADTVVYSILFADDDAYNNPMQNRGGFGFPGMGGPMGRGRMGGPGPGGGRRYPQQRPDGKKVLERVAEETGGRFYQVSKKDSIEQIFGQIAEELRNQYNIGYTPQRNGASEPGYHKIQLTAKKKDLAVQARDGYYGKQ